MYDVVVQWEGGKRSKYDMRNIMNYPRWVRSIEQKGGVVVDIAAEKEERRQRQEASWLESPTGIQSISVYNGEVLDLSIYLHGSDDELAQDIAKAIKAYKQRQSEVLSESGEVGL